MRGDTHSDIFAESVPQSTIHLICCSEQEQWLPFRYSSYFTLEQLFIFFSQGSKDLRPSSCPKDRKAIVSTFNFGINTPCAL